MKEAHGTFDARGGSKNIPDQLATWKERSPARKQEASEGRGRIVDKANTKHSKQQGKRCKGQEAHGAYVSACVCVCA